MISHLFFLQDPLVYHLAEKETKLEPQQSLGVLTGSGMADAHDLYSREAHKKRSLQMYSSVPPTTPPPPTEQQGTTEPAGKAPLVLETYKRCSRSKSIPEEKTEKPKEVSIPATQRKFKGKISVSGNYISPPPHALGFSRRAGKFRTSLASRLNLGNSVTLPSKPTPKISKRIVPQLRVVQDMEESSSNG